LGYFHLSLLELCECPQLSFDIFINRGREQGAGGKGEKEEKEEKEGKGGRETISPLSPCPLPCLKNH